MVSLRRQGKREGYEYSRVLLKREALAGYAPTDGWEVVSYGPPFEKPGTDIAISLRRPLPPVARPETILDLAMDLLHPHGKCTLSWMSGHFGLSKNDLIDMLCAAGIPRPGSERPWLRKGDFLFWFDGVALLRGKWIVKEEPEYDESWEDNLLYD